jgi:CRP-like cAMP-binding protein
MPVARDLLARQAFLAGLSEAGLDLVGTCSRTVHVPAGAFLFREGEPAGEFYLVHRGRVAIELHRPGRGAQVLDTVEPGEIAGLAWLVPPYRWFDDARAVEDVEATAIDGVRLRAGCDADPELGYAVLQRVTRVMLHRLQAARVRLLDVYGAPRGRRD